MRWKNCHPWIASSQLSGQYYSYCCGYSWHVELVVCYVLLSVVDMMTELIGS